MRNTIVHGTAAVLLGLLHVPALAQDELVLAHDTEEIEAADLVDLNIAVTEYEPLNGALGGDSVRHCNGYACIGWVEDHYADGALKHRGYYDNGQLLIYRNFYPDGALEREFKVLDNTKSLLRTYHPNGVLRTEAKYAEGEAFSYADHYRNGQVRYEELKHRQEPYYLRMNLYAPDGTPISLFELVDRKRVIFQQREYHANGQVKLEGRAQYDPARMDSRRIGTWTTYDEQGRPVREEDYVDGRVERTRDR